MLSGCRRVGLGASVMTRTVDKSRQGMKIKVAIVILGESPGENWCICRSLSWQHYTSEGIDGVSKGREVSTSRAEPETWALKAKSKSPLCLSKEPRDKDGAPGREHG